MSKLLKTKNFIIIQGGIIIFIIFSFIVGVLGFPVSLLELLARLFGDFFNMCIDMGPEPGYYPTLPCFYNYILLFDFVLAVLVIVYFFIFIFHKLKK